MWVASFAASAASVLSSVTITDTSRRQLLWFAVTRKRKKQRKSPYLCSVALFICLANSVKVLVTAVTAGAVTGGLLR